MAPVRAEFCMGRGRRWSAIYRHRNWRIRKLKLARSYDEYLRTALWASIRRRVLDRDKGQCRVCGNTATQAHHTNYRTAGLTGSSIGSIIAICDECHLFAEFNEDGSKAHPHNEVRHRLVFRAAQLGRTLVLPKDELVHCDDCGVEIKCLTWKERKLCSKCFRKR